LILALSNVDLWTRRNFIIIVAETENTNTAKAKYDQNVHTLSYASLQTPVTFVELRHKYKITRNILDNLQLLY
jgi:hypothetical protein